MNEFYKRLLTLYKESSSEDYGTAFLTNWSEVLRELEGVASSGETEAWFSENRQTAREVAHACGLSWENVMGDVQFVKVFIPTA